jgi:hypothetical protein
MKVGGLIDRLRQLDSNAEVYLQLDRRSFALRSGSGSRIRQLGAGGLSPEGKR